MQIFETEQNEKLRLLAGSDATETICPCCHGWVRKDQAPRSLVDCHCTVGQILIREAA